MTEANTKTKGWILFLKNEDAELSNIKSTKYFAEKLVTRARTNLIFMMDSIPEIRIKKFVKKTSTAIQVI